MARFNDTGTQKGRTASGDTTATPDETLYVDASGGPVAVTLPAPSNIGEVTVKKVDSSSNAVTIATPGSETIDGDSNRTLDAQFVSRTIGSDGSNYFII